jgi:tol-pal system protein YbgF
LITTKIRVAVAAGMLAIASGCVTVPEFRELQRDVARLKGGGSAPDGTMAGTGGGRLADLAAEVDSLHAEIAALRGEIEEARHLADQALAEARAARAGSPAGAPFSEGAPAGGVPSVGSRGMGAAAPSPSPSEVEGSVPSGDPVPPVAGMPAPSPGAALASPSPSAPGAVPSAPTPGPTAATNAIRDYEDAFRLYRSGSYREAIGRFEVFVQTYPTSDYADNALFWLGECHYKLGEHERAVLAFADVVERFPAGNKVPDALYRQGMALLEIGRASGQEASYRPAAREIFERIVKQHPTSDRVAEAKLQLERMGR